MSDVSGRAGKKGGTKVSERNCIVADSEAHRTAGEFHKGDPPSKGSK